LFIKNLPLTILLPIIFFIAVTIQLYFILFVYSKILKHQDSESNSNLQPVSIIIAAANELENLKELLPLLDKQNYPEFEILIADDRSNDETYDYLLFNQDKIKHLTFLRIKELPDHFTAKKYAVTMAIKKSKYNILLFTDADCRPTSENWIRNMVAQLDSDKDVVLGFSKYIPEPGRLNAFIRYETFQTALLYFSFALARMPFMGVGRNLMYKKEVFWKNNGFASHHSLLSGDDDLFVNQVAKKDNCGISISPESYTTSIPKNTWSEWYIQKIRHLSVGKRYKTKDRLSLGLLWFSGILTWLLFIPAFFVTNNWFIAPEWSQIPVDYLKQNGLQHWYVFSNGMRLITGVFLIWLIIKWIVLAKANKKIGNTVTSFKIPFYDFQYAMYLIVFGMITLFSNPKKIRWR
jgi:glycosyltransferase involved in cell wall biosynthesis